MTFYRDLSYPFFDAAVLPRFDAAHLQMQAIDEESPIACGEPAMRRPLCSYARTTRGVDELPES